MNKIRSRKKKKSEQQSWISSAADWLTVKLGLEHRLTAAMLIKILWVGFLAMVYIFFQHNMDKLIRNTNKAEKAVHEKRALYITNKASYLFASKQSEVEKKMKNQGFENTSSPIKITVTKP